MTRYFIQRDDNGRISIALQDDNGYYIAGMRDERTAELISLGIREHRIKLPEWDESREVLNTDPDYIEFVNRMERNPFTEYGPVVTTDANVEGAIKGIASQHGFTDVDIVRA